MRYALTMDGARDIDGDAESRIEARFGPVARRMLAGGPLIHAWRFNFLANFFTASIYREFAADLGLTRPEFVILYCLSEHPGLVARDVCYATGLPKNSISRAVATLLEKGLIERETREEDRRAKSLAMTQAGSKLLSRALPLVAARQDAMRAPLDPGERAEFDRLLRKMIVGMPDWVGAGD